MEALKNYFCATESMKESVKELEKAQKETDDAYTEFEKISDIVKATFCDSEDQGWPDKAIWEYICSKKGNQSNKNRKYPDKVEWECICKKDQKKPSE